MNLTVQCSSGDHASDLLCACNMFSSLSTISYLRKRLENLNQRERLVSLLIDEVYTARQVEYQNGKFYGYENQEPTKTLLCPMIKGVAS